MIQLVASSLTLNLAPPNLTGVKPAFKTILIHFSSNALRAYQGITPKFNVFKLLLLQRYSFSIIIFSALLGANESGAKTPLLP